MATEQHDSAKDLPNVVEKKFTVRNKLGLHARPASLFVQTTNRFRCEVMVQKGKQKVNGKSIMGIMMLAAGPASKIAVRATGPDAARLINELEKLFEGNFGEKE
jgi:phosphocarrier protein